MAETVRAMVSDFVLANTLRGADGQINRAAQLLGVIAAAGELATAMGLTPWREGHARDAAAWALARWIEARGGTEPAEVRQAIEQVRLFIEQHGEDRFDNLDDDDAHPVHNRAGWREGEGEEREWLIPTEAWKADVCSGLDPKFVARTLAERGIVRKAIDGLQRVHRIAGRLMRVYVVTSRIFDGGDYEA
jgi:putative DNA primase/helicase